MSDSPLFNEHWFRVRDLTPSLAGDVEIQRHVNRQQVEYVLHRKSTTSYYRLGAKSFELVGKFDGTQSVNELWELAIEQQGAEAPTQAELIQLLAQLHEAELLVVSSRLDAEQLFQRGDQKKRREKRQRYLNPLFMRFRLLDPDRFLSLICPYFRFLFNRTTLVLWGLLLLLALSKLAPQWNELQNEIAGFNFLSPQYALLFLFVYPALKLLHELAHGITLKRLGGEVHEFGISLMVLLPIPYVDASAAAALPDKRHRILVSAAGIMVELAIAAIATLVWLSTDGLIHDIALILMLIGSLSTVIFNANPLLKFDGYYILADLVEIPNLAQRSKQYVQGIASSFLIKKKTHAFDLNTPGEKFWLIGYGISSTLYRIILMISIAYLISDKYFFFGAALALWIAFTLFIQPGWSFLQFITKESSLKRPRAILISGSAAAALVSAIVLIPVPLSTVAEGIVWLPEHAIIRVANTCEVTQQNVQNGQIVQRGDILFVCEDPEMPVLISTYRAELRELEAERQGQKITSRVSRNKLYHQINTAKSRLASVEAIYTNQIVRARNTGQLVIADDLLLEGRFLEQGAIAAYVVPANGRTVHVPIGQDDIGNLRNHVAAVEIQFSEETNKRQIYQSAIVQHTPQASFEIASAALSTSGGGKLLSDPAGDDRTVIEPVFNLELAWPENAPALHVGSRVWVKIEHADKPIFFRLLEKAQRAFLGRIIA